MATSTTPAKDTTNKGTTDTNPVKPSGLSIPDSVAQTRESGVQAPDVETPVPVWEQDDAPAGSTSESLMIYNPRTGQPERVAPETHYGHLANGAVVLTYGIGTHHTSVDDNGKDVTVPIMRHYPG